MTALTGRTWAMRLLSLRVIDTKTGLIPTGGQSIGRSIFYLLSLATVVGILFALLSREGYTAHDRFTRTAVITKLTRHQEEADRLIEVMHTHSSSVLSKNCARL